MTHSTMATHEQSVARTRALEILDRDPNSNGFELTYYIALPELDADAFVFHHTQTGARLLYLATDDENKAFAIGFKTPPANSTGVFHILEHSVLCGSTKFPVKEPFVDLIKSSMQTFLNAMTYDDKTVYPVASTNEQDLLNLMDVYMDAVLNPAIYTKPTIFEQEGWHLELDPAEDGSLRKGTLRLNGVVYNEMKGALSDPMSVLDDAVMAALFPDTAYAFESGGDPKVIPNLTYDEFLNTHARHYNLANSYMVLYGDFPDIRRELAFLNDCYLARPYASATRIAEQRAEGVPEDALAPNPLGYQEPVTVDLNQVKMVTTPDNALVGMAYVLGDVQDQKRIIASDVLFDALLGSNEAPIKKAIIATGLGGNVASYTSAALQQPYELIVLQNAKPDIARLFRKVIVDTALDLVEKGIPRDRLEAVISSNEYALRQRDYGTADGVVLACDALSTWLYSDEDEAAVRSLAYADIYDELRRDLKTTFFEDLLRELVLENNHSALVELVPTTDDGEARAEATKLAAQKDALSDAELEQIVDNVAQLRAVQEAEDTPEAKATLPRLHVSDIGPGTPEPKLEIDNNTPLPCIKHTDIPTRQLAYALTYFDLSHISYTELPYVKILCRLMQQLPTTYHTAAELDSYIGSNLGFLSFTTEVYQRNNPRQARPLLLVAAGALSEKIEALAHIPQEIWAETQFDDTDRIRDVLTQLRIGMEQSFLNAGHQAALGRSLSYVSPAAVLSEQLGGVDFYLFLCDVLAHFDERVWDLCEKLRDLQSRIFTSTGTIASFTGSEKDYERYWSAADGLGLNERTNPGKELFVPAPEDKHEAFIIPSDVSYTGISIDPRSLKIDTNGAWAVAANALSYDYLWNEIRVKGGAYGCGFRAIPERQLAFYTYRDPAIDPSLTRIAQAGNWLSTLNVDDETFEGFIVSTVSGQDAPVKPYALTKRRNAAYFSERPEGFRDEIRSEMLAATPEDLRAMGEGVARVAAAGHPCVFGGRNIIEASNAGWNVIDLFG